MADSRDSDGRALQRILDTPHLAQAIRSLRPELLHRVIQRVGLEDAAELVALATPEQLSRVFDLDLWRATQPGLDEQFDASRFGTWLQVLLEGGVDMAAEKLAGMSPNVVAAGLAQHVRVFDAGAVSEYMTLDGTLAGGRLADDGRSCDIAGYCVVARREDAWDAITEVLIALESAHAKQFHRLMADCRAQSNSTPEESGMDDLLEDREQAMFDLAVEREQRRDEQGYVTPAQAHAFLEMARRPAASGATLPNPIARVHSHVVESPAAEAQAPDASSAHAALVEVLIESDILPSPLRALLAGSPGTARRLSRIQMAMHDLFERDPDLYMMRNQELGYLANTLVSGCSVQARAFTPQEAADAAVAVCNLGLENWPHAVKDDVLVAHDLIAVFQIGWAVLYERVSLTAARRLIETLAHGRTRDRSTQMALSGLRAALTKHVEAGAPWRARGALEVLATLDVPAWAVLGGLLGECPVAHDAINASRGSKPHTVSATAFEFISDNGQLDTIDQFLSSLDRVFFPA